MNPDQEPNNAPLQDPVLDEDYPRITEYVPELDDKPVMPCAELTMEEVNPDGAT